MSLLFSSTTLGSLALQNRLVMAPMTRDRAIANIPNELMTRYYAQRASVGLIITEGTSPSPNGVGYARIPGIYSTAQIAGWQAVTKAVHAQGAKIFLQLMHCGRVANAANLPAGARAMAPSAIMAEGEIYTDTAGMQPHAAPLAMTETDIKLTIEEYAQAARNAVAAGFDGIELHAANGYLLEQFIRPTSNHRSDQYGGSIENRARFVLEVVDASIKAIGKDKVGIRLSPFGVFNDMPLYPELESDYAYLAKQLNQHQVIYVHLVDHSSMGAPPVPDSIKAVFRTEFKQTLILSGGYDKARAEQDLESKKCDLIAVGRQLLANPDLANRWQTGAVLNEPDFASFYTPGPHGYTDYAALS